MAQAVSRSKNATTEETQREVQKFLRELKKKISAEGESKDKIISMNRMLRRVPGNIKAFPA